MASRTPPRFVPTLTEVVQGAPASSAALPTVSHEQIAQRVLQRVDLALDGRVREAIATVVLEQTNALGPLLRERLEAVVREVVAAAVAEELQARQRAGPGSR
ncbi:MAG: hypothetical protein JWP65_2036 [Ramlibacter sp.]|jgi:hypothetical protein|uniref:hypothetical protein n=1 Tax=Ramlibacter sp. TaxID=1917967 RepID=UPI00262143B6|nr:hypothetical protein [Ramlibacter sp.]MDB5751615.1 hypothetical protein [Ramlibacter sp.]